MPATTIYKTPGVYVAELAAFPPSVVAVATAIPVFIGYTEKATVGGKPVLNTPIRIGSLAAFQEVFGAGFDTVYNLEEALDLGINGDNYDFRVLDSFVSPPEWRYFKLTATNRLVSPPFIQPLHAEAELEGDAFAAEATPVEPAPTLPRFNLYNSMRLFYDNGGADCYVVSVGTYGEATGGVKLEDLRAGLTAAGELVGPTMTVIPDAVLLPPKAGSPKWVSSDFQTLIREMLAQAAALQDRICILDVYGSQYVATSDFAEATLDVVLARFREDVGSAPPSYGAAYFPFLDTSVIPLSDVTYLNIDDSPVGNDPGWLTQILSWENKTLYAETAPGRFLQVQNDIESMDSATDVERLNQNLLASLPILQTIELSVIAKNDVLPPSGAMAGVYTRVDAASGVWNAPANVSLNAVDRPTVRVDSKQQENMNVPVDGKAVNALRAFPGRGTVVWGARTLNGNSPDYRYIQVRRTLIWIEQSIKAALDPFVFAPNNGQTWATVVSMVSGFLTGVWQRGGLMGATAKDAFTVACGLGSTMTGTDILDGYMIVQVTLSLIRPAEFIELTFKQTMEGVG